MPRAKSPNYIFVQWLKDLRDAEPKDSNRHTAYNKALGALTRHPVAFTHPSECIVIKGIGPKIVKALEEKFIEYHSGFNTGGEGFEEKASTSTSESRRHGSRKSQPSRQFTPDTDDRAQEPSQRVVGGASLIETTVMPNGIVVVNRPVPNGGSAPQVAFTQRRARISNTPRATDSTALLIARQAAPPERLSEENIKDDNVFAFFYLDEYDNHVQSRDAAAKKISDDNILYHKIEFQALDISHPLVASGAVDSFGDCGNGMIRAWISDHASDPYEKCPGYKFSSLISSHHSQSEASSRVIELTSQARSNHFTSTSCILPKVAPGEPKRAKRDAPRLSAQMPVPHFDGSHLRIDRSCIGVDGMDTLTQAFPVFSPILLPAGTYRIVLLVDMREDRRTANDVDRITDTLTGLGVACERRTLELGDVLWIAKRVHGARGDEYDEVVLDFIVERKRMDDLISSLKDDKGRYHDQKFRLHQCAMKHVFYIVEGNGQAQRLDRYSDAIATVASSTQVVDGFMVKETASFNDTLQYLALLHSAILDSYKGNAVHVIPSQDVRPHSYVAFQKHLREVRFPDTPMQLSLKAFNENNSKKGSLTVDEVWARMLLSVNGLGAAKVATIRTTYKGPAQLSQAFCEAEAVEASAAYGKIDSGSQGRVRGQRNQRKIPKAENMLTGLDGRGRETIGAALSRRIYRLMRTREYDAPSAGEEDMDDSNQSD